MIKSIELVNWKTHKRTHMNFQKGVNVLVGVMGAGKSSVIDGISFGLFGTFPSLNHKRTTIDNLISDRPSIEENAEVRITFTIGNDEYSVTRKIKRGGSTSARLEKNSEYLQTQPGRVNEEVEGIIKTDYDTFSRAIYAEQNGIDYFLELTKGDRKRQIDQMLGLDSFAKAEENSVSLINSMKYIVSEDEKILAQSDMKGLKVQLERLAAEKGALSEEQKELSRLAREKESELKRLSSDLSEIKSKYEKSKELERESAGMSGKIDALGRELKKIESMGIEAGDIGSELKARQKELESRDSEIRKTRKEESELLKMVADADAIVGINEKKALEKARLSESVKGKALESMESALREEESHLQESNREISSLAGRKDDIRKWAKELAEHISKCPVCERELDEKTRKALLDQKNAALKDIDSAMKKLEAAAKDATASISESRKELERTRLELAKLADYQGIEALISENSSKAKKGREEHSRMVEKAEKLAKESERLNKEIGELKVKMDSAARAEKYRSEIKEMAAALERLSVEMKGLKFDEKKLYELQEMITRGSSSLSEISSRVKGNERYIKGLEAQIADKAKEISNINAISERIEKKRIQISNMNRFRTALMETESQLRNSMVTSINMLMQDIWTELYPYGDYIGIKLDARKDDYLLQACTGEDANGSKSWIEMDGIASGGERSIACLTMRIALAMVIVPNLRWLILDEPTHNIDENGINKFIEVLGSKLPNIVEQIFIITHDSALKGITSARVYSLERNKDKNEYTSIAES
ncbi:MAG: hypothetical protein KGI06_02010 [Candidatus Micrarchaeota archaeon]|nr:hypothetical protein [Candidatus Micrarchaeota archaeon]